MLSKLIRYTMIVSAIATFGILFFIVGFILINGIFSLSPNIFEWEYTSTNVSLMPALLTTFVMVMLTLMIATPIGVFTAIYLVEYAKKNNKIVSYIRLAADTLAGIPSIVFGLFGMLFFVTFLQMQYSIIAGILTSVIMVLPIVIRTSEEALLAVNPALKSASFGLGAGKLRTVFQVILPVAMPGILSGIVLSTGRIVGETAALMYTLGTATNIPTNVSVSSRTLALHMYVLSNEGFHVKEAYATGIVLLIVVLVINFISTYLSKKAVKSSGEK